MAVRIPKPIVQAARLREGDPISLSVRKDGTVLLRPTHRKYRLEDLLAGIKPTNLHAETDWGKPVGKEVW